MLDTYRGVFGSYTFRFISNYAFWLSVSVFALLGAMYTLFGYNVYNEIEHSLEQDLQLLEQKFTEGGVDALEAYAGSHRIVHNRPYYLLVSAAGDKLAGSMDSAPELSDFEFRWLGLDFQTFALPEEDTPYHFAALRKEIPGGHSLVLARSMQTAEEKVELMFDLVLRGTLVTIVLGVLGGAGISLILMRRVEAFNNIIRKILAGDLSKRLPINRYSGDFRELEININRLLARIQELMAGVRRVSDNIAHDLRTPLTRLRNHVAQLEEQADPANQEIIDRLSSEADDLLNTFNAALKIAKIETGNPQSEFSEHDLALTIADVVELYEPVASDKDISISQSLLSDAMINGDRDLLFQVVANLLDNAIKYTGNGGLIAMVLERQGDKLLLQVRDNGIGIPAADRHRVFERFFRVEASRGEYPGNGLGLSLVAAVVKYHQGSIRLLDNSPGLCVVMELPTGITQQTDG